jgi:hypothetical protein
MSQFSSSNVDRLVEAFIAYALPREEWTHTAHLKVGLWHCLQFPYGDALDLLRERIKRYNVTCGVANTETQGYHETITQCYLHLIYSFLKEADLKVSIDDALPKLPVQELPQLIEAHRKQGRLALRQSVREWARRWK